MSDDYQYKPRRVRKITKHEFRFGEGKISGFCSISLGILSVLGVIAYLFPAELTTRELREVYDAEQLQIVLKYGMYGSIFFGLLSFLLHKGKHWKLGMVGVAFTFVAFLLGGYTVPVGPVEPKTFSLGVDWAILAFIGSVLVFLSLEKLFPKYRDQLILRPEWGIDLFYFIFNHLAISAILIFANYHASHFDWAINASLQETIRSTPIWLQFIIVVLCADFVLYWEHRLYHEFKILWPIHAVHHSIENLDWLASSRGHFIQVFSERAMVMIPLYLLGVDEAALNLYVTFAALQAVIIHCNISFSFGPIRYLLVTPQFHHWHHSSEQPAIDTNYSAHTVLFDRLFGTYHFPDPHWPAKYGTTNRLPRTLLGQTLYPITAIWNRKQRDK